MELVECLNEQESCLRICEAREFGYVCFEQCFVSPKGFVGLSTDHSGPASTSGSGQLRIFHVTWRGVAGLSLDEEIHCGNNGRDGEEAGRGTEEEARRLDTGNGENDPERIFLTPQAISKSHIFPRLEWENWFLDAL